MWRWAGLQAGSMRVEAWWRALPAGLEVVAPEAMRKRQDLRQRRIELARCCAYSCMTWCDGRGHPVAKARFRNKFTANVA